MNNTFELRDDVILHRSAQEIFQRGDLRYFVDAETPHWAAVDARGARLLEWIDGRTPVASLRRRYAEAQGLPWGKAWEDTQVFLRDALRYGLVQTAPREERPYLGREAHMAPQKLQEFWIHLLQTCNLSCTHCLVSSGPKGERGGDTAFYRDAIDQAHALGARRFYFTGGEPFLREDLFELIRHASETRGSEVIVMTNATLLMGKNREGLSGLSREKVRFQVSLDGASAAVNDKIRGAGVFEKAAAGLKLLAEMGFETSLTAAVTGDNIADLEDLPALAKSLGAASFHLMWLHKRGRALDDAFPSNARLLELTRQVQASAEALGVVFDNSASLEARVNGRPGVKYDLGNLCWESLCLYMDGRVYPSAATAGHERLVLGDLRESSLETLWRDSAVARKIRRASVAQAAGLVQNPFRFLTGGGDMEHSFFFSDNGKEGVFAGEDPYHGLYTDMIKDVMERLGQKALARFNRKTGFDSPVVVHGMGEGALTCSEDAADWLQEGVVPAVKTLHSNCVLAFDVDKPYRIVQTFYGAAAEKPQAELCCPVKYDAEDVGHIPQDVLDRFYGCGSPIAAAQVRPGETTLDLGSGAGIDVFTAAKKVGPGGKAIGVDMTDPMLDVARRCQPEVARNLGYDVAEFRKGFLEKIPAEDKSVDVVTSNCVINLSPDKGKVFSEIWRILKDGGRMVVADIVSDRPVPLNLQAHKDLWGECISGSLSEEEFLAGMERAGFYGIKLLKRTFWKTVEGHDFYSITVWGHKLEKSAGCRFVGHQAIYLGPGKALIDEEGHLFPRNEPVEVCTDTAVKLAAGAYAGQFRLVTPEGASSQAETAPTACCAEGACC